LAQIGQAAVFHINHVIPRSKEGLTEESNLVLQCPYCSLHKSNKLTATDPSGGKQVELFHPLTQLWHEHFILEPDGYLRGLTSVGRATIEALRMNDPLPRIARSVQIDMGLLFPGHF
jgi:hypothetical protein